MLKPYAVPRPSYRFQLGLTARSLPRRFIPGRFGDLTPGGPYDALP
jgi:hypothetical protein